MSEFTEFAPLKFDQQAVSQQGWGMAASGPTDDKLIVGFYKKSVLNKFKSKQEAKPVFEGHDYVKIQHPGETLNIVDRPARDDDKTRWPQRWAQYQAGVSQIPDGVPLSLLFPDKPQIADMMRAYNIHTVEQLANLSAQGQQTVGMGAVEWVTAAKKYMERADKGINHHEFEQAMQGKDSKIATLERQIEELSKLVRERAPQPSEQHVQTHDFQTEQINRTHQSVDTPFTPEPAQFVHDLSNEVQPQRRRGRPPGSKNKEH